MKTRFLILFATTFAFTNFTFAQKTSLFERLTATNGATLTLSTNVSALIEDKKNPDYQTATLTAGDGKHYEAGVKSRGKFRRRISEIPPLKIKVKKKILHAEGLDTLNELKLVLPTSLDEEGNERVVREYLAYRMYEQITPYHVRARLINLTLINTGLQHQQKYEVKAILLEDEEETCARLGGTLIERFGLNMDSLNPDQAALMAVFQYMIGNTDWSIAENRNVRLLETTAGAIIPVPFDFDFCGFVDAPYAVPLSETGLRSVRERYMMAGNLSEALLKKAFEHLQTSRQTFDNLCREGHINEKVAERCVKYLNSFFREKI